MPVIPAARRRYRAYRSMPQGHGETTSESLRAMVKGAWLCISLTRPELPKSMSRLADSPTPDNPRRDEEYLSWVTNARLRNRSGVLRPLSGTET